MANAKIRDKYSIEVLDIEREKRMINFRYKQSIESLRLSESEIDKFEFDPENEIAISYFNAKKEYDKSMTQLDSYLKLIESEAPIIDNIDSLIPYYEESNGIIYQKWEITKNDPNKINEQIDNLRQMLTDSDYKITKCYEASLLDNPLPYDIKKLHAERQEMRNEIKQLETLLL